MTTIVRLSSFNGLSLPSAMARSDVMGGSARMIYTRTVNGWFDEYGTDAAIEDQRTLTHTGVVYNSSQAVLESVLKTYEGFRGVRGTLVRIWASGSTDYVNARCQSVTMQTDQTNLNHVEVSFSFITDEEWT